MTKKAFKKLYENPLLKRFLRRNVGRCFSRDAFLFEDALNEAWA